MDTLTFRAPILLRHLTFSEQRKIPISEIDLEKVLTGLDMSYEEVLPLPPLSQSQPHTPPRSLLPHKQILIPRCGYSNSLPHYLRIISKTNPPSLVRRPVHPPRLRLLRPNKRHRPPNRPPSNKGTQIHRKNPLLKSNRHNQTPPPRTVSLCRRPGIIPKSTGRGSGRVGD